MKTAASVLILLLLAGCAAGPNYQSTPTAAPAHWSEPLEGGVTGKPAVAREWWKSFHDPALDALISQAVASNYDLRISAALVREARESLGMARAGYGPAVDATASWAASRSD